MEIERKFLTKEVPFSLADFPARKISQCYISMSPTIRLRQWDDSYILTVKGKGLLAKEEFELEITKEEYDHLLTKAESPAVEKVRYLVPLEDGLTAEVDVYEGKLTGLMTTEVEFPTLEEAEAYEPPYWFGKDVSFDHRYKNTSLSLYGIPEEQECKNGCLYSLSSFLREAAFFAFFFLFPQHRLYRKDKQRGEETCINGDMIKCI